MLDHGGPAVHKALCRGAEYRFDVPRWKLEMLVPPERAEEGGEAIAKMGSVPFADDGRTVMVYDAGTAIRIRSGGALLRSR